MKKLLLVGAFALFGAVNAQENSIKVNPAALLGGADLVTFEHKFGDRISAVIGGGIGGYKIAGSKYSSAGGGVQGRYYFDEAMTGFYGAVVADYNTGKVEIDGTFGGIFVGEEFETENHETKWNGFGAGLRAGYQWIFDSGITLDLNVGAAYKTYTYDWDSTAEEEAYGSDLKANGIMPAGSLGIGYSF